MSENTTQETNVETPVEDKAETVENQGVNEESVIDAKESSNDSERTTVETELVDGKVVAKQQNSEEAEANAETEAEQAMFDTIMKKKGFKDAEDFAKSYSELERSFTTKATEAKNSREELEAIEAVLDGLVAGEISPSEIDATDNINRVQGSELESKVESMQAQLDVRSVANKYPDFADMKDNMSQILKDVTPEQRMLFKGPKGIETLYKMAKSEYMDSEVANAKAAGKEELTLKEIEKARATVADGNKTKPSGPKVFTRADIAKMSPEEYLKNREVIESQVKQGLIQ